jgi:hypothetical protein
MDDYMLMMMKMRGEERVREAMRGRRVAEARRAARARQQATAPARGLAIRPPHWVAMAAARKRPVTTGR